MIVIVLNEVHGTERITLTEFGIVMSLVVGVSWLVAIMTNTVALFPIGGVGMLIIVLLGIAFIVLRRWRTMGLFDD